MKAYVGVTDGDWYRFLADRPTIDEVNFWRPSGRHEFRVLTPGEPFFFKTHYPDNRIVGGGFFSGFASLTLSAAWDIYGEANGAATFTQMRTRVAKYRREPLRPGDDPVIGCVFVRDVVFFAPDATAGAPADFAPNIVQGKSYTLTDPRVDTYFADLLGRLGVLNDVRVDGASWHRDGPVFGDPRLAPQRLGQRAFQGVVLGAYHGRCAITQAKIRPVLQAAHIRPVAKGGEHRLDNGLLLRSDVHTMFDRGYLSVDPKHRLMVSPRLREEFGNGERFYAMAGQPIALPDRRADRPNQAFLEWHLDEVFLRR